ncbi:hypothetical protein BP6252_02140 [Coleophoma cylindrospora]|uniref:Nudix hydrolase domain-containing protein n=1 Tax=Coleophoma cylindrospora TaxID=1849047 RepID=A0A3D8SDZ4_9HELO|nr:hypothetical protein BP6252_02140 [Coleophoma cylindrospora]
MDHVRVAGLRTGANRELERSSTSILVITSSVKLFPAMVKTSPLSSSQLVRQIAKRAFHQSPYNHMPAAPLRQRAIVSSFLCTSPQSSEGATFALFKRSQDVSAYRGKWAVCSGSIETTDRNAKEAAQREVMEETQLRAADFTLLAEGEPYSLRDEALKTEWRIHPFAWQLGEGAASKIVLDREHTEFVFIKPGELSKFDHVENLELGLGRVLAAIQGEK